MPGLRRVVAVVRRWLSRGRSERELHNEVESYARLLEDEHRAAGLSAVEARRRALVELGGLEAVKEQVREQRAGVWLELLWRDAIYAARGLSRSPVFAITAVATLALAMVVNVTTFSIVDAAAFRPLPYERPDELVYIRHSIDPRRPSEGIVSMAWDEWRLWRAETTLFAEALGWSFPKELRWRDRDQPMWIGRFTADAPRALGITPLIGRSFTVEEANVGARVLLLSERAWDRDFRRLPTVIGATVILDEIPYSVIGVMPAAFRFGPGGWGRADGWMVMPEREDPATPGSNMTTAAFRLRPGTTLEAANRQVAALSAAVQRSAPSEFGEWTSRLSPIEADRSAARGATRRWLLGLLVMSVAVLGIGCANVANLQLVRAHQRAPELAMRTALGATRGRLLRLLLIEGAALAAVSVTLALIASAVGVNYVIKLMPPLMRQTMFEAGDPAIDARVLLYSLVAGAGAAILAGAWPAWRGVPRVASTRTLTPRRHRVGAVLQAAEIALVLVVVASAVTMSTSFWRTIRHDLGIASEGLGWLVVSLPLDRSSSAAMRSAVHTALVERVRAVPGVSAVALGQPPLLPVGAELRRADDASGTPAAADLRVGIEPGYFGVLGMQIREGREFSATDVTTGEPVVIIDESAAHRLFPAESALGRQIRLGRRAGAPAYAVVGVVNDAATSDFNRRANSVGVYLPAGQLSPPGSAFVQVRASREIGEVLADARLAVSALPSTRVLSTQTISSFLESKETFSSPRFFLVLTATFAALALMVGSVGIYGLLSFDIGRRRRDIGIRMALGASPWQMQRTVAFHVLAPVAIGIATGGAAWLVFVARAAPFTFGVEPGDPRILGTSAVLLAVMALAACVAPLRRAVAADVLDALKEDA